VVPKANYSIQRVESNRAGKSLSILAKEYNLKVEIEYRKTKKKE
jgi:hypothetical protein